MSTKPDKPRRRGKRAPQPGLINPRFLDWVGETRVARFGLLLIGLDDVKSVREALGAEKGERLVRQAAQRIRRRIKGGPPLRLPRAGCFAALVRDPAGTDELITLSTRLLEDLRRPVTIGDTPVQTTASIGMAIFPDDGESLLTLLQRADLALERARQAGGDGYQFYDRSLNSRLRGRWDLNARLWAAFEKSEFTLAFQPTVHAQSGGLQGAEALLRWVDAERGPQSPADFVPLLEHSSLIVPVGEWVLRTACREARRWLDLGLGRYSIGVNLSPRQFEQPALVSRVRSILVETGLPPDLLLLEITENELMRHPAQARVAVEALHAMGVRVLIDDFGTGYSSISYLKYLPVKGLKIDRSFVAGLPHDRSDILITEMIISLARTLNLEIVAEGVETAEQATFLRERGVNALQGYLFGRPMGADEFDRLLRLPVSNRKQIIALTHPLPALQ